MRTMTTAILAAFIAAPVLAADIGSVTPQAAKLDPYGCRLKLIPGTNAYQRADADCFAAVPEGNFESENAPDLGASNGDGDNTSNGDGDNTSNGDGGNHPGKGDGGVGDGHADGAGPGNGNGKGPKA